MKINEVDKVTTLAPVECITAIAADGSLVQIPVAELAELVIDMADKAEKDLDQASDCGWIRGLDANGKPIKIEKTDVKKMLSKSIMVESDDFNELIYPAEYVVHGATKNKPIDGNWFWVKVVGGSDIMQIATEFYTLTEKKRTRINSLWTQWK